MNHLGSWMQRQQVGKSEPLRGSQDILEVTKSLEKQRASSKEDPIKEAAQQAS